MTRTKFQSIPGFEVTIQDWVKVNQLAYDSLKRWPLSGAILHNLGLTWKQVESSVNTERFEHGQ